MIVTTQQLAKILHVADTTVTRWIQDDMPVATAGGAGRGNVNEIDLSVFIPWYIQKRVTEIAGQTQKDRLDQLKGDKLEREFLKEDGLLVLADEFEVEYTARVVNCRAALMQLPTEFVNELRETYKVEIDSDFFKTKITNAINKLMESMYDDDISSDPEEIAT